MGVFLFSFFLGFIHFCFYSLIPFFVHASFVSLFVFAFCLILRFTF